MPFDIEISLPKPELGRPRIDEKYGMLQLGVRFLTLLTDLGGLAVFIFVAVTWNYINPFATAAAAWAVTPGIAETIALCNTSRRIKRIPVVLIMVLDVITMCLLGGSWFWYLYGPGGEERELSYEVLHGGVEDRRSISIYVSFALFAFHTLNLVICWVDLCRRGY